MCSKNKKYGVILRTYATKEQDVEKRVKMVQETVKKVLAVEVGGEKVFSRTDILVWSSPRFKDSDCGKTVPAMKEALAEFECVEIEEVKNFDLFCGILNYGVAKQLRNGIDYSLIMSPDVHSYMTPGIIEKMIEKFDSGAKAVGLAINELTESIKEGRLANTFLLWDNLALLSLGGFDFLAKKLTSEESETFKKAEFKRIQGVEEVIPLARLTQEFGPCLAVVVPDGVGGEYILPTDPELLERHLQKMRSKKERQDFLLSQAGFDTEFLKSGVMPQ
ncbi:MAG: hypothetical protein ACOZAR_03240 [Patescibacteria group bacterium]